MQTDYEEDSRRLGQVKEQADHLLEHNEHLQSAHMQVQQELEQQRQKLERVAAKCQQASEEHRRVKGTDQQSVEETVFRTEALRDTSNSVLYTLGQLSREFPEITDSLNKMLQKAELQVPSRPPSRIARAGDMPEGAEGECADSAK